ncbi:MAG: 2-C-methyl-D-erythritol 2,4-cyclodiphosphate synthase [Synergistaceae bacterium]|jgi:2-C-methyl-D-erythritol 4-phosphate cytidylyltransferase/2-C-methyl-D-erythritol 2,4-cyclodiphosphate synthase|nr:2-C-methyl-D-erythritol 2,4-cyclodiphosphate synthase [Synergistaceae bacterium]
MNKRRSSWSFLLMAAGVGSRMGGAPKQFRTLGDKPMWLWGARAAERLHARGLIDELVVVFPDGYESEKVDSLRCPVTFTTGGEERTDSVVRGLEAASSEYVMIHDAARPFLDIGICEALMEKSASDRGVVPLLPSIDSLKEIKGSSVKAIPREMVFRTQTPQAFGRQPLLQTLREAGGTATDEATIWLSASRELAWVPGDEKNFKITNDFDWFVAKSLVNDMHEVRTGFGYDVHELVTGRRLVLGGLEIPSPLGLLGHSDADVICHAISDALLGASGLGDIGGHFPASDMRYKDIDSTIILELVLEMLSGAGWSVNWIDVVLIAQVPRLGAIISDVMDNFGRRFTVYNLMNKMNIKVKSGEYIGSAGRAECMECHAVATIERFVEIPAGRGQ